MIVYETSEDYRADDSPVSLSEIAELVERHGLTLGEFLDEHPDRSNLTRGDVLDWLGY